MPSPFDAETLRLLSPELVLTSFALLVLILDFLFPRIRSLLPWISLAGLAATVLATIAIWPAAEGTQGEATAILSGMMAVDPFALFFKIIAALTTGLVILSSLDFMVPKTRYHGEFYGLLLLAALSMTLLAAANDLIMIFLALEFLSLTSYVLTGYLRDDYLSIEGGLKYLLYGAVTTAVALYGMSLLYGITGETNLLAIAQAMSGATAQPITADRTLILPALVFILAGFGFKISLVPFHQWTPDAYEGAPTPIAAFLSVGPKAVGFAILIRVLFIGFPAYEIDWVAILSGIALVTMTFGNLVAIQQQNIKRLLAYSSISQVGYILLGVVSLGPASIGQAGVLIYLLAYLFTNLGAFAAVVAFSHITRSDNIADYAGLVRRSPLLALALVVFFMSLAGIPPTGGFVGKLFVFGAAVQAGFYALAIAGVLNSVVSLYYYFAIVRRMFFAPPRDASPLPLSSSLAFTVLATMLLTLAIGIYPQPLIDLANRSVTLLGTAPF